LVVVAYGIKGMITSSIIRSHMSPYVLLDLNMFSILIYRAGLVLKRECKHGLTQSKLWPYGFVSCKYPFMNKK
jgi:hypothetical protein